MDYTRANQDHPADPDTPWVASAEFIAAYHWLDRYPPSWGEASCSNARCECGADFEVLVFTCPSATSARFMCNDCAEESINA